MKKEKMKALFYHCDIFSPRPELYINGYNHLPNTFGSILSIITVIIIFIAACFFFDNFFNRTITSQIIDKAFSSNFSIELNEFPIIIQVQNSLSESIGYTQDAINITPAIVTQYVSRDSTTGRQQKHIIQTFLELEPCDINKHLIKHKDLFRNVSQLENYYCIKDHPEKAAISGIYGEDTFTTLNFYLELNSSYKKPESNIIQKESTKNFRVLIKFVENYVDSKDGRKPVKAALKSDIILFTDLVFKREWFYLSQVTFEIENGFIFSNKNLFHGFESGNYIETIDFDKLPGVENTQSVISFLLNSKATIYRVTYIKLPEILANIGGITNGIIYLVQLLIWVFTRRLYTIELINDLIKKDIESPQNKTSDSKMHLMNQIKKYRTTTILPARQITKELAGKMLNLNCFQCFLPKNWTWTASQILIYKKKSWIISKNLDVKFILENNLRSFQKKLYSQPFRNTLGCNNMTILSHENFFKEND